MRESVMKLSSICALVACAAMVGLVPTAAADGVNYNPGGGNGRGGPNYNPGGHPSGPPPHGNAYGFHCKGLSKKHVKGQQGTAFSRCVKSVAQMRKGIRYESPPLAFGPNGWAGWSC